MANGSRFSLKFAGSLSFSPSYVILLILVILFAGRVIGSPIALSFVVTRSMEPTIRQFDLAVLVKTKDIHVGDIAVWCLSIAYCVIHRVVGIDNTGIRTRGDANPVEDPGPIPFSKVYGKVAWIVPREIVAGIVLAYVVYRLLRFIESYRSRGRKISHSWAAMGLFLLYVVALFVLPLMAPIATSDVDRAFSPPRPVVKNYYLDENGRLHIILSPKSEVRFLRLSSCRVKVVSITSKLEEMLIYSSPCMDVYSSSDEIVVEVPVSAYSRAVAKGKPSLKVSLVADLTARSKLYSSISLVVRARRLEYNIGNNTITIHNGNFFPLNITIKVRGFKLGRYASEELYSGPIPPHSTMRIKLSGYKGAYVYIYYVFEGKVNTLVKRLA